MLIGQMMDRPLNVSQIIAYAADIHPDRGIVSRRVEGDLHRYGYRDAYHRIAKLAHGLRGLGIQPGDRVATLAWNGYRHFELYYAIAGLGSVCHTINPRLFVDQIVYIINHAEDQILFCDLTFVPLIEKVIDRCPGLKGVVIMTDRETMPNTGLPTVWCYEDLLEPEDDDYPWPVLEERTACGLCYTSGTTGHPKGVLYSNRSAILHSMSVLVADKMFLGVRETVLPVVPLFHVNAWGLPYSAPLSGTPIVFPGPSLDGKSLFELMQSEGVTNSWGVPTVWLGLLNEMKARGRKPDALKAIIGGGSAMPLPMIQDYENQFGVEIIHAWGMTELSPIGTFGAIRPDQEASLDAGRQQALKAKQGRRIFGVELKIVDGDGKRLPHDGKAFGDLYVRGPTVTAGYFRNVEASAEVFDSEGWYRTVDVVTIDADGYVTIVYLSKDVIKSGC